MNETSIPIINAISAYHPSQRAWLCDIWGVLHNGVAAFAAATAACRAFRERGGLVLLVSNAPRPHDAVARQLEGFGIGADVYDAILSSGDVTRELLKQRQGQRMLHIGPDRDRGLFEGISFAPASDGACDFVLCSGLLDDNTETPETYRDRLRALAARKLPMLCANPDIKVERGNRIVWCGGALAALYGDLGGHVTYAGKPHAPVYDRAFAMLDAMAGEPLPRSTIVAIGDGVHTDIKGAADMGIASVYVASPVNLSQPMTPTSLDHLFAPLAFKPSAAMHALAW